MEKSDLKNEFIREIKEKRNYNIPEQHNVHRDPSYIDFLENKLIHSIDTSKTPIHDLLHLFFNNKSDANKYLIAEQQEDLENEFSEWVKIKLLI